MCCGSRSDKQSTRTLQPHVRGPCCRKQPLHGPDAKVVTGTVRLDSSTNKPTKPLNTLGIFVASNSSFWDVPDAFPHQLELQINRGHKAESALPLRVSALPVLSFAELAL